LSGPALVLKTQYLGKLATTPRAKTRPWNLSPVRENYHHRTPFLVQILVMLVSPSSFSSRSLLIPTYDSRLQLM
jgi:hypothetical protein